MLKIEIEGVAEFNKTLAREFIKDERQLEQMLAKAAFETHGNSVKGIQQGARSGRTYRRRTVTHQASSAGEMPKTDTGRLVSNITIEKESFGYSVGSRKGAPHGFWLEFGTSKMKARPWLQPSFDKMVQWFNKSFMKGTP